MLVETYEVVESCGGEPEDDSAAIELIGQLGLEGQQKLVAEGGKRNPYRMMTVEEVNVYGSLLTTHEKLSEYDAGPIPLRVLQVAAHATSLNFFKRLEVWHSASVQEKDPVLVGCTGEYSGERFILARWGSELEPFSVLAKKAAKVMRGKLATKLHQIKSRVEGAIAGLKDKTDEALLTSTASDPSLYGIGD